MARFRFNAYRRKARGTPRPNDRQVDAVQDPTPAPNLPKSDSSALVDCIPCPALLVDQERRIDAVNLPLCDAFGLQGAFLNIGEKFVDFACRTSLFGRTELLALGDFLSAEGNRRQIEIVASNGMTFNARACDMTDGRVLITLEKILSKGPTDGKKIADSVIENLPGAVLRLTHRRHHRIDCIFASPRSPDLFGCSMGKITGPDINFLDLVADEYRSAFETAMMKGTHKTTAIDMEIQIRNGTVGPLWVRSVGVAVPGPDGSVICDLRMINVEDRRKLQEERQRLERLLNLVIDNIPSMVSVRNADDRSYLVVNRAYEEMRAIADRI